MAKAQLIDYLNEDMIEIQLPPGDPPAIVSYAMRFFVRQPSGLYREADPYLAREPWPKDWREQYKAMRAK